MLIYKKVESGTVAIVLLLQGENIEVGGHFVEEPKDDASITECTVMKVGESGSSVTSFESNFSVMSTKDSLLFKLV